MAAVELREIVTDSDREAVMRLRRKPGQERYLPPMDDHFEEAATFPQARPRMFAVHDGDRLVGFVMISDDIPQDVLDADSDLIGPFYLWRLLIDAPYQGRGYGRATIAAVADWLRANRPNADVLWTSCAPGDGSPQPFYVHLGFVRTERVVEGEDVLGLAL